jgi:hypothetical protein
MASTDLSSLSLTKSKATLIGCFLRNQDYGLTRIIGHTNHLVLPIRIQDKLILRLPKHIINMLLMQNG